MNVVHHINNTANETTTAEDVCSGKAIPVTCSDVKGWENLYLTKLPRPTTPDKKPLLKSLKQNIYGTKRVRLFNVSRLKGWPVNS